MPKSVELTRFVVIETYFFFSLSFFLSLIPLLFFANTPFEETDLSFQTLTLFRTVNSLIQDRQSLKYQRFTLSGCNDVGIIKLVSKDNIQFLCLKTNGQMFKFSGIF